MSDAVKVDISKPIDFSNVSSGGTLIPEGDYVLKVVDCKKTDSKAGNPMLTFKFEVQGGPFAGRTIGHHQTLTEGSLWSLRALLDAIGYDTSGKIKVDPRRFIGDTVIGKLKDGEPYKGRVKSEIVQFIPLPTEETTFAVDEDVVADVDDEDDDSMSEDL